MYAKYSYLFICSLLFICQTVNCASPVSVLRAPKLSTLNSPALIISTSYKYIIYLLHTPRTHYKSLICQAIPNNISNECSSICYVPDVYMEIQ